MDSNDSSNQSIMKTMMKYDDSAIALADIRCQMKNSIIKHYAATKKMELSNLRKLKFVEVDRTIPKMTLTSETQAKEKTNYTDSLKIKPDILQENEHLSNELSTICDIIQKLRRENGRTILK